MLSLGELRELGLSRQAVSVRAGNGRLHRLYRAVYAVGHPNPGFEGRMLAAVKACGPNAVLSHHSAAELWGFMERTDRSPDVTIPASERRGHAGIGVHQSTRLEPRDRAKFEGIPVTTPARTLLDLAAVLEYRVLRGAVRRAEGLHRASPAQLEEVLDRLRPRRGGAPPRRDRCDGSRPDEQQAGGSRPRACPRRRPGASRPQQAPRPRRPPRGPRLPVARTATRDRG